MLEEGATALTQSCNIALLSQPLLSHNAYFTRMTNDAAEVALMQRSCCQVELDDEYEPARAWARSNG